MRNLRSIASALYGIVLLALLANAACAAERQETIPLERLFAKTGEIDLGPATSRVDYQSIDPQARRLYISKMGAGQLLAVDIGARKLVARLDGFPKTTGVLSVPELHRVYASVPGAGILPSISVALGMAGLSSGHGALAVVDSTTLHEVARLPAGVFPDGIAFDSRERRIFVSDELGSAVTVFDANTNKPLARIDMGGEVGNVRYDASNGTVYAPVQSRNELVAIDPAALRIVHRFPLPGGKHPHGLAIAPNGTVAYAACDDDDRLLTVDLQTGRVLDNAPVAHDPDVLAIDAGTNRLYVASESGALSTFDISAPQHPVSRGEVFVASGAHSVAADPVTHDIYLPLADHNGRATLMVLSPRK